MHGPINVKSPNNISEWQMGFNSAFKGLMNIWCIITVDRYMLYCTAHKDMRPFATVAICVSLTF